MRVCYDVEVGGAGGGESVGARLMLERLAGPRLV